MAGRERFERSSCGFGDRCFTIKLPTYIMAFRFAGRTFVDNWNICFSNKATYIYCSCLNKQYKNYYNTKMADKENYDISTSNLTGWRSASELLVQIIRASHPIGVSKTGHSRFTWLYQTHTRRCLPLPQPELTFAMCFP